MTSKTTKTMVFPRTVRVTDNARNLHVFEPGPQEVPVELVEHPYLKANGVVEYKGEVKRAQTEAEKAQALAEKKQHDADEAARAAAVAAGQPGVVVTRADVVGAEDTAAVSASQVQATEDATSDAKGGRTAGVGGKGAQEPGAAKPSEKDARGNERGAKRR